jgi:DNA invertase Pin-like site-specific DNA recombinase
MTATEPPRDMAISDATPSRSGYHRAAPSKILTRHRALLALVYVRQSSTQQIHDHPESRARQYGLAEHAVALGWPVSQVVVIDEDQGQSGQRADHRLGFQRLLTDVTLGRVGLVLGLEMSRLARSGKDWHHLLEVCALVGTLLADQDGVYDPTDPNDRLLLGLKGTMSEIELVTMRNRLERGRLHKAERGELFVDPPLGYIKLPTGGLALEPDEQARAVVRLIFDKFDELGTLAGLLRYFRRHAIRLGRRERAGPSRGQLVWASPNLATLRNTLNHPFYAGAYAYGRRVYDRQQQAVGRARPRQIRRPMAEWRVLLHDRVPAYITWDRFLENQARLRENDPRQGRSGVPRQGTALLTGLIFCGACGHRLQTTHRHANKPYYICVRNIRTGTPRSCTGLQAGCVDSLVAAQVLHAVEPAALEVSLRACRTVEQERERLLELGRQQVERMRYEAERAERQYHTVEPENRLVARTLEQRWEAALRTQRQAEIDYERLQQSQSATLTGAELAHIRSLAADLPSLWQSAATSPAERKGVVRCLIERVVAHVRPDSERVRVTIHWRGGFTSEHTVIRAVGGYQRMEGCTAIRERIVTWRRAGMSAPQIAARLNAEGFRPPKKACGFGPEMVRTLMSRWGVGSDKEVLGALAPGEWWLPDLSRDLRIDRHKLRTWIARGWVHARRSPAQGLWIAWADHQELTRLGQLRDRSRMGSKHYPAELTTPKPRP